MINPPKSVSTAGMGARVGPSRTAAPSIRTAHACGRSQGKAIATSRVANVSESCRRLYR